MALQDMTGEHVFFVRSGLFVSQDTVSVENCNFWPVAQKIWQGLKVEREVKFTANRIEPGHYFGEQEVLDKKVYTLNISS